MFNPILNLIVSLASPFDQHSLARGAELLLQSAHGFGCEVRFGNHDDFVTERGGDLFECFLLGFSVCPTPHGEMGESGQRGGSWKE